MGVKILAQPTIPTHLLVGGIELGTRWRHVREPTKILSQPRTEVPPVLGDLPNPVATP